MKTERRHELQTNTLADHLGKWIIAVRPYTSVIIIAFVAVAVVTIAWQVTASLSAGQQGKAWDDFEAARSQLVAANDSAAAAANIDTDSAKVNEARRAVRKVIDDYEGQPVAYWAHYLLANHYQTIGTRKLFFNRGRTEFFTKPNLEIPDVPKTIPRVANEDEEWVAACKGGPAALSNFSRSGPFTEMVLLGNLAIRAGEKVEWDPMNLRSANSSKANEFVRRDYRKGWEL